jgi:prolipoprotein diacylglyceryltransferase
MSYSFLMALGAALGLLQIYRHTSPKEASRSVDAGLIVMAGSLLGARLLFVLMHFSYYKTHHLETLQLWQGGLNAYGAIAGGLLAAAILSLIWKSSFLLVTDQVVPLIPPLAIFAVMGSWQAGVGYGAAAPDGAWWGVKALDESGAILARFPLQLVTALALLLYYGFLELRPPLFRNYGIKTIYYLAGLAAILSLNSFLRADPAPVYGGLRLDSWLGVGVLAACILASLFIHRRRTEG